MVILAKGSFALLLLTACRNLPPLPAANFSDPGWRIQQGQAIWRSSKDAPEIAGELLVAVRGADRAFVQFTKTPLPFVTAQTAGKTWSIEFPAENKTYSGRGHPPARLAWLHLARGFTGIAPPREWNWKQFDDGRWRLENESTGELLEGYLNP